MEAVYHRLRKKRHFLRHAAKWRPPWTYCMKILRTATIFPFHNMNFPPSACGSTTPRSCCAPQTWTSFPSANSADMKRYTPLTGNFRPSAAALPGAFRGPRVVSSFPVSFSQISFPFIEHFRPYGLFCSISISLRKAPQHTEGTAHHFSYTGIRSVFTTNQPLSFSSPVQ